MFCVTLVTISLHSELEEKHHQAQEHHNKVVSKPTSSVHSDHVTSCYFMSILPYSTKFDEC